MLENERSPETNGVIMVLSQMPPDAIIDEAALAKIFGRCPTSVRRAIQRRELPPGVRLFGKQTWTARVVLDHLARRLEDAKKEAERTERRISALSP
ncbi:MAG: hypothetical protein KBE65_11375 [Phycisphaerae bacterium]|nr:hypothetical protein [Phycisphaerae bacterium]